MPNQVALAATHIRLPLARCLEQKDLVGKALRDCWQTAVPVRCSARIRTGAVNGAHRDALRCDILVGWCGNSGETGAVCFVENVEQGRTMLKPQLMRWLPGPFTRTLSTKGRDQISSSH